MERPDHLWEIDVIRLLTFAAVIAVHVLAFTEQPDKQVAAGAMMLLQFGREVFFALTGFVLVYSTWDRPFQAGIFWRKRLVLVAVPYVAWTIIYYGYAVFGPQRLSPSISGFSTDLLGGGAMYHLYFLLVTIQLYLAFPLVRWFVQRTAERALPVLALVTAANLGWLAACQYLSAKSGVAGWIFGHAYELLPTYSMYVLAGCYAAVHFSRLRDFVERRPLYLLAAASLSAGGALTAYVLQLQSMTPRQANGVLQPGMALSCLAAVLVLGVIGSRWATGARRGQRGIEILSDASFGVYLAHPLILQILLDFGGFGNSSQRLPAAVASLFGYAIVTGGAVAVSLAVRRTPLSMALAGRPRRTVVNRLGKRTAAPMAVAA